MKLAKIFCLLLICALLLSFSSCDLFKKEKTILNISGSEGVFEKDDLLDQADLILQGTILEKTDEFMTNPTGKSRDRSGALITNRQITDYSVEISKIYKGTFNEDTITIKTSNGNGLSPDLILYGEDDKHILATPLQRFDLDVGKECIFLLTYIDDRGEEGNGYYCLAGKWGYYPFNEEGIFLSKTELTLDPATLPQEIIAAKGASLPQDQPIA